ncbi:hypothetical protein NC651_018057 [Populus alba x Populus x berolinensis]|nr:hypothetical protein NC651_018057 [Populus alba x Populus x berolinensis]
MTQITLGFMNTNMLTPNKLSNRGLPLHYTSKISFRDKVVGSRSPPPYSEKRDLLESRWVRIEYETGNRLLSKVFVDDSIPRPLPLTTASFSPVNELGLFSDNHSLNLKRNCRLCEVAKLLPLQDLFQSIASIKAEYIAQI